MYEAPPPLPPEDAPFLRRASRCMLLLLPCAMICGGVFVARTGVESLIAISATFTVAALIYRLARSVRRR